MGHMLEQFDPSSEGFALVAESLEAAGVSLEPANASDAASPDDTTSPW